MVFSYSANRTENLAHQLAAGIVLHEIRLHHGDQVESETVPTLNLSDIAHSGQKSVKAKQHHGSKLRTTGRTVHRVELAKSAY